jgi:hypothetical protein
MLGMLMIPKTIAYVAVGFIAYYRYFVVGGSSSSSSSRGRTSAVAAIQEDGDDSKAEGRVISSCANSNQDVESPENDEPRNNKEDEDH